MDSLTPRQLHDFAPQMRAQLMAQDAAAYAAGRAQQIATLATAPADVARVQAWGRQSDRVAVITEAPTLVTGSWIAYRDTSTMAQTRAVYECQYKALAGVRIERSPAGRHFIMLDDPARFAATLESFVD